MFTFIHQQDLGGKIIIKYIEYLLANVGLKLEILHHSRIFTTTLPKTIPILKLMELRLREVEELGWTWQRPGAMCFHDSMELLRKWEAPGESRAGLWTSLHCEAWGGCFF